MLGIVGERACCPFAEALSSSILLWRCAWKLLTDLSCLGVGPDEMRPVLNDPDSELWRAGYRGAVVVTGVWPCGRLQHALGSLIRRTTWKEHLLVEVAWNEVN